VTALLFIILLFAILLAWCGIRQLAIYFFATTLVGSAGLFLQDVIATLSLHL